MSNKGENVVIVNKLDIRGSMVRLPAREIKFSLLARRPEWL